MGIARVEFLFDYKSFGERITPILESLKNGDLEELRSLAKEVVIDRPETWKLLDYLTYFPNMLDNEEKVFNTDDSKVVFWMDIVICCFCSTFNSLTDSEPTPDELEQLGVDKEIIKTLIWGKPISDLLLGLILADENSDKYRFWKLGFKVGWLSTEDIEIMRNKIQIYHEKDNHLAFENLLRIFDTAIKLKMGLILSAIP